MAHYSEMDFLFSESNKETINRILSNRNVDNTQNIYWREDNKYVVYKRKDGATGTNQIKSYLTDNVYKTEGNNYSRNPYVKLVEDFDGSVPGLFIQAADLAYLRDLGVYPMNRMAILRRFPDGCFVKEDLSEMTEYPVSTVIGWIPPDQNFGNIGFNETWGKTTERFDQMIAKILEERLGIPIKGLIPIPAFAQGLLFELYKYSGIASTDENGEQWSYKNIPIGDPNMLMEGPFRDPSQQNIQSTFSFKLETTYEQKLLGDVDPGSAMLDIIDNLYAMGTSNMKYYWSEESLQSAKRATIGPANSPTAWWDFIDNFMFKFWSGLTGIFSDASRILEESLKNITTDPNAPEKVEVIIDGKSKYKNIGSGKVQRESDGAIGHYQIEGNKTYWIKESAASNQTESQKITTKINTGKSLFDSLAQTILTSTVAIYRYELRGSIELMAGGRDSSTPWYLTIGNPYSPWLATNHIIVKSANIETSTEMGFNDQPQWLKATFDCEFSRSLGRQELMRMFNNTYRRNYSDPSKIIDYTRPNINDKPNTSENQPISEQIGNENGYLLKETEIISNVRTKTPIEVLKQSEGTTATVGIGSRQRSVYTGG